MAIPLVKIEAIAPDQSSVDAARKLLKGGLWPRLAWDGGELVWGECQGSGATPYRVVITESDAGYKCSCPSRKFPCKHSLALMWMRVDGKAAFAREDVPDWVKDWLARRRGAAAGTASTPPDAARKVSLEGTSAEEAVPDGKAAARAVAAQERNRKERESSILAGLDELDVWLSDQVERGMAAFVAQSGTACRTIAQRLVDAKAPALATRVDSLTARLFELPEAARAALAVEELGLLHLLAEAYRRQDSLPAALKADVRQAVGWNTTREALLADEQALRIKASWRVVGALSEVQPDKLRRIETWLFREGGEAAVRFAVLIDFVPVSTGATGSSYAAGDRLEAELTFYPSAVPLRALVSQSFGGVQSPGEEMEMPRESLDAAYASYLRAMRDQPWLAVWPLPFRAGKVRRSAKELFVSDVGDGRIALPIRPTQRELVLPLAAVEQMDAVGIWDGRFFTLCWAQTELGRWVAG